MWAALIVVGFLAFIAGAMVWDTRSEARRARERALEQQNRDLRERVAGLEADLADARLGLD